MDIEYVSIAQSRAGSAEKAKSRADEPTPETSVIPAAKTNDGGKSASNKEG